MSSSQSLKITELLGFRSPLLVVMAVVAAMRWLRSGWRNLTCDVGRQSVEWAAGPVSWMASRSGLRPCAAWVPVDRFGNPARREGPATDATWHLLPRVTRSFGCDGTWPPVAVAECGAVGQDGTRA
jgi:hypothetical protein